MVSNTSMVKSYIVSDDGIYLVDSLMYYQYTDIEYPFTDHTVKVRGWTNMITFPYNVQDHDKLRGLSLAIHTLTVN